MAGIKILIPKISNIYTLYVYSSKNANDINTLSKVKELQPLFSIDESVAVSTTISGREMYELYDDATATQPTGVTYYGPSHNCVPCTLYDTSIDMVRINNYTYLNAVNLIPFNDDKYIGTLIYYTVVGVDNTSNVITHISKTAQALIECPYKTNGTRFIYACDDFKNTTTDEWKFVSEISWDNDIVIGDPNNVALYDKLGIPVVETVPAINDVTYDIRTVLGANYVTLNIQNPWQANNKEYNFRKLKSFKIQNVVDSQYGEFSEPTFQSTLPVSIEKMLILRKTDLDTPQSDISINDIDDKGVDVYEIIRQHGIFYDHTKHYKLSCNKYTIPAEENVGVFSEASLQEKINMQIPSNVNHNYTYTIYLIDVYNNISSPFSFVVET